MEIEMTRKEIRTAAVNLYKDWSEDSRGFKFFQDFVFSSDNNPHGYEVADKAIEMLWDGALQ